MRCLSFKNEPQHFYDWNLWHQERHHSLYGYTTLRRIFFALIAVVGGLGLWLLSNLDLGMTLSLVAAGLNVLVCVVAMLTYGPVTRWYSRWVFARVARSSYNDLCIATKLCLEPEGLREVNARGSSLVRYENLGGIAETDKYVFVYVSQQGAHVIPKSSVPVSDLEAFLNELRSRHPGGRLGP